MARFNVHFTIGNKTYKTIYKAQKDFNLKSSKPIYQALIDGMFRGKKCKIIRKKTEDKYLSIGVCERSGTIIKCNETGKQYMSVANLYRALNEQGVMRVPYPTLHRALFLHNNMRVNGLTYTITKRSTRRINAENANDKQVSVSIPKVATPKVSAVHAAKDNLMKLAKEKLTAQIKADQFNDTKETMQMIEWLNNQ